ncbi:hypothetical protein MNBD_BACTEROID07-1122 [hydrothermal vent metagenome]|uniref:Uncharacterized protein n=1 Tax=hydrothermal vent metagenome TaxID=652676 RepID=A0A3B0UTW9_9ZZZZ
MTANNKTTRHNGVYNKILHIILGVVQDLKNRN